MEIIILTVIITTLFMVFILGPMFYVHKKQKIKHRELTISQRLKRISNEIADMESDGIYFSDHIKGELKKHREDLHCNYSGLPSVNSYKKD